MTLSSYSLTPVMVFFILVVASASTSTLENTMVVRYVDISSQLVIVNTQIKFMSISKDPRPIDSYVYIVDPLWVENLAYIEVLDYKKNRLGVERDSIVDNSGKTVLQYKIFLPKPLISGESTEFTVSLIITNYLKSYPKSVKQNEKHTVLFSFNVYYHSMYFSHVQTTNVYMGTKSARIDGAMYTVANESEYGLQYGPFYKVEPFKDSQSVFHYENNSPFLIVEKVKRFIKISHWGYISVWDQIQLLHSGPKFQGPFKRGYNQNKHSSLHDTRIEGFVSSLPSNAFDIYLKDEIGLIWRFQVNYDSPFRVDVSVQPRNILYGGWKTQYEIGYSLPISDYVTDQGRDEYILSIPLIDKIFQNMVINEAEINIILPEGANFEATDPYVNNTDAKYCYYFDITCREMITFKRHNLVERHLINNVSIAYTFSQLNLIVKPLVITFSLFFIFILMKMFSKSFFSEPNKKGVKRVEPITIPASSTTTKKKIKRNSKQRQS